MRESTHLDICPSINQSPTGTTPPLTENPGDPRASISREVHQVPMEEVAVAAVVVDTRRRAPLLHHSPHPGGKLGFANLLINL